MILPFLLFVRPGQIRRLGKTYHSLATWRLILLDALESLAVPAALSAMHVNVVHRPLRVTAGTFSQL